MLNLFSFSDTTTVYHSIMDSIAILDPSLNRSITRINSITRSLTLKHIAVNQVLSALERLVRDEEAEIRITSARTLEQFCADLDEPSRKRIISQHIIPLLKVSYRLID